MNKCHHVGVKNIRPFRDEYFIFVRSENDVERCEGQDKIELDGKKTGSGGGRQVIYKRNRFSIR